MIIKKKKPKPPHLTTLNFVAIFIKYIKRIQKEIFLIFTMSFSDIYVLEYALEKYWREASGLNLETKYRLGTKNGYLNRDYSDAVI